MASLQTALEDDQTDVLNYVGLEFQTVDVEPLLLLAVRQNFLDVAKLLLRAKADANCQGPATVTPLLCAAAHGYEPMVALLLEQPDLATDAASQHGDTALSNACEKGYTGIVQRLLDVDACTDNALPAAAVGGHLPILEMLLQHKADVNQLDHTGRGALHVAALNGRDDAASLLLNAKAHIDLPSRNGWTPLMFCCKSDSHKSSTARLLLAAGANVHHRTADMITPLLHATIHYHPVVMVALLDAGANPNAADSTGRTALSHAADLDHISPTTMMLLVRAKADPNLADSNGDTPLIFATKKSCRPFVEFLLGVGADVTKKGQRSARQIARGDFAVQAYFQCSLCWWQGMCCGNCRKEYCVVECDKFSGKAGSR